MGWAVRVLCHQGEAPGPGGTARRPAGAQVTGRVDRGRAREVTRSCPRTHTPASGKHRLGPSAWLHQPVTTGRRWQFCRFCSWAQGTLPTTPALTGPCAGPCAGTCRSACSGRWPPCARLAWRGVSGQSWPAAWEHRFPDKGSAGPRVGEGRGAHVTALLSPSSHQHQSQGGGSMSASRSRAYSCRGNFRKQGQLLPLSNREPRNSAEGLCLGVC